jgi:hypothetical protein
MSLELVPPQKFCVWIYVFIYCRKLKFTTLGYPPVAYDSYRALWTYNGSKGTKLGGGHKKHSKQIPPPPVFKERKKVKNIIKVSKVTGPSLHNRVSISDKERASPHITAKTVLGPVRILHRRFTALFLWVCA